MRPQRLFDRESESGLALLLALIALSLFSLIGLLVALDATSELRISDNHESHVRAENAARAGISHARELLRGIPYDDLLEGPDGVHDGSTQYINFSKTFSFRNPLPWALARSLDLSDPAAELGGLSDDGLLNTGFFGGTAGTVLIPVTGVALMPGGWGGTVSCRYFAKVTDNNGEASELAGDPADDPFHDGDGLVIVRSAGVARTIAEMLGAIRQCNSVSVIESRFRVRRLFDLDAPLVLQGRDVEPATEVMFDGDLFLIQGGPNRFGIAAIDIDTMDGILPAQRIAAQVAESQEGGIQGANLIPSITDVTALVAADGDKKLVLDPAYLMNFVRVEVPRFADTVLSGNQTWSGPAAPDLGRYEASLPPSEPGQRPRVTLVDGDLAVTGPMEGAGVLVVTGRLTVTGDFKFCGLVLVIGSGGVEASSWNPGLSGGIYLAALVESGGGVGWGTVRLSLSGNTQVLMDEGAIAMALRLLPPVQVSCREITPTLDP
jgi:hypothetical protein